MQKKINPVDLVLEIKKDIYLEHISSCEGTLNTPPPDNTDMLSEGVRFYQSLNESQKNLLFYLIKNSISDTISNVFGWLDGVYYLENQTENLELKFEKSANKLNGSLQDIWLAIEEGDDIDELRKLYDDF
ncbi:hypothetical protein [Lysinibacillus xylanilyticus]|uniref:Uncharacterized protein n=1 Tax=Lysinibacillus xylanilyticus TaxID=582475 RepID=A0ABT4EW27_9BACI|nr:hypothetical protein [Lysinibacillus xylanilyticus]MCY9549866.1 hypothetical protein [Lysinibacillus xylanilyticus]